MNEQIKAKWIDALGSGEYPQAIGCLNDGKGFCCLGVLADLHVKEGEAAWLRYEGMYKYKTPDNMIGEASVLPYTVRQWSGLENGVGSLPSFTDRNGKEYTALTQLNDDGFTFEQISDFIRAFI